MIEYRVLKSKGITPVLYVHPDCPVTTIYDMYPEEGSREVEHGTCGHGIFRTKQRHFEAEIPFTVGHMLTGSPMLIDHIMNLIHKHYGTGYDRTEYLNAIYDIRQLIDENIIITAVMPEFEHTVFEGSQGLMLDEFIGTMPHCTPSDITPRSIMQYELDEIFIVTRSYQSRHGNGPITNEGEALELTNNEAETCRLNEWQGEFRTTLLDLDQLIHAKTEGIDKIVPSDTKVSLVVTCMDQLSNFAHSHHGRIWDYFENYNSFILAIQYQLRINGDVYINDSPRSTTVRLYDDKDYYDVQTRASA